MNPKHRIGLYAVAAFCLLFLSALPVGEAMDTWNTINEYEESVFGFAPVYDGSSTRQSYVFDVEARVAWMYVAVDICLCGEPDTAVTAVLEGPGRVYGPWVVDKEDLCHSGAGCAPEGSNVFEFIIVVDPPLGRYEIVLTPGPGHSELPPGHNGWDDGPAIAFGGVEGHPEDWNNPYSRGNDFWKYYPDGSRIFVEDGGYVTFNGGLQRILAYGSLATALVLAAYVLIARGVRRGAPSWVLGTRKA